MSTIQKIAALTESDVFDLVIEFLTTKGFSETSQVLKKEVQRNAFSERKSGTRLEDLLEKSYVTELASGDFLPRKKLRSSLDPEYVPLEKKEFDNIIQDGQEAKKLSLETILIASQTENDPYGAAVMPIYQTATFAQVSII